VYFYGAPEELVGRTIRRYTRREDVVLATKLGLSMHDGPGSSGLSRKAIIEQIAYQSSASGAGGGSATSLWPMTARNSFVHRRITDRS